MNTTWKDQKRWEALGVTDPAMAYKLTSLKVDIDTAEAYFDLGITDTYDMYRLSKLTGPKVVADYQSKTAVSVDEIVQLVRGKVGPDMILKLLEQFPGMTVERALKLKKTGVGKGTLALATKLGIEDIDLIAKIAAKITATILKDLVAKGAVADDFFDEDGNVVSPSPTKIALRRLGRSDVKISSYQLNNASVEQIEQAVAFYDFEMAASGDQGKASSFAGLWYDRGLTPAEAKMADDMEFRLSGQAITMMAERIGVEVDRLLRCAQSSPGLRMIMKWSRVGNNVIIPPERFYANADRYDLLERLRSDLEGTAAWLAPLLTVSPVDAGVYNSSSRAYVPLTQCEGIQWQLDLIESLGGDVSEGLIGAWEDHYGRTTNTRGDAKEIRDAIARRIVSRVSPAHYFRLEEMGISVAEMRSIVERSENLALEPADRTIEDDEEETHEREPFMWDDIEGA